ncbi:exodeoxyribonuclease V subunit alpha [Massilia sp. NEAU-DD11]|uniref:RecBCD enzyme subunit RecD n=1 Tax=Massilia cellulosiltytica TaxID=2683234 RepID=A0A7X3G5R0_9BURK|nr:exodeoxyribonuclease V subunit alpha [Telluria cellulosilytica]MVW64191.1 exodeoxyribonuclease V subunit alpha [Telluria cellulosilytica]
MTSALLLDELDACADEGGLRRLGCAFARFIATLADVPPCVLLSCVLLSELESRGDTCLSLDDLVEDPCAKLHLTPEQCERLHRAIGSFPASKADWAQTFSRCEQVYTPGKTDHHQPLVLENDRLYLRRFWRDERSTARLVGMRAQTRRTVDPERAKALLDKMFPRARDEHEPDWQKIACAIAARSQVAIITGGPGTGKTYTVARLLALLYALSTRPQQLRFALAAPSGKAAVRLKQSIDKALQKLGDQVGGDIDVAGLMAAIPTSGTLHSLLGANPTTRAVRHDVNNPLDVDVLIVDEASMVHLEMMADVLEALPANAILVLLGDKDQLSSVEAGAVLGDLCDGAQAGNYDPETAEYVLRTSGERLPPAMVGTGSPLAQCTVMLRKSHRYGGAIGQLALAVNANEVARAQDILSQTADDAVAWRDRARQADLLDLAVRGRAGAEGGYARYLELVAAGPQDAGEAAHEEWVTKVLLAFDQFRVLCAVRQGDWGVEGVNEAIEQRLIQEKFIVRSGEWYAGRPVMVTQNDHAMGVFNGDVGVTLPDASAQKRLRVYFQGEVRVKSVLPTRLPHIETAYAMTVHKVQGSEYAHTVLALPNKSSAVVVRELIYTGITRASTWFTLCTPNAAVLQDGMYTQTKRISGLRDFMRQH